MHLTLRAVSLDDRPLTRPITAHFDAQGGTIGRADNNLLALPDPERYISRQQAQISIAGGAYRITNVGSPNPILVRGRALQQGESMPLAHRDQLRIGGYLLEVTEDAAASAEAPDRVVAIRASHPVTLAATMPAATAPKRPPSGAADAVQAVARDADGTVSLPRDVDAGSPWQAFCEGAGLSEGALAGGLTAPRMRLAGAMLRGAVEGCLQLMALHLADQRDHGVRLAAPSPEANPLKFANRPDAALEQLLQPPAPGVLGGAGAMRGAMQELTAHAASLRDALPKALDELLGQYSPTALETRLGGGPSLDNLPPMMRKARLWELYAAQSEALRLDARAGFEANLGRGLRPEPVPPAASPN